MTTSKGVLLKQEGCHVGPALPDSYEENQARAPLNYPYHAYRANGLEPCCISSDEQSLPVHMLTCGHLVAIETPSGAKAPDNRCGLNCLHVADWMKQQTINAPEESIDLRTGNTLGQALTSSAPVQMTKHPILPKITLFQSNDDIYCEICYGIPASSFFAADRKTKFKYALAMTRTVIEYFTGYSQQEIVDRLCRPFFNPKHLPYDWKLTHLLRCGHEVWAQPARPCASNCSDNPECKCRIFPGNEKQGDVIFCHECTYRAEMVYARYANAGKGVAVLGPKSCWQGVLVPGTTWNTPTSQSPSPYGVAPSGFGDSRQPTVPNGLPLDPTLENDYKFIITDAKD
ncbi:hypothetical protein BU23DRAFT_551750 [Bimuria novae-zelandiae CBS 107.79]|uniref:Uncharacterized protein n=1 Tax=Bimuria novae-zelandiae CBS 107.79 TaxID=1447943 RepID=A0A6A5VST1_9PLEO|nr:hypothetical protein BU23DRAFT_551750 [Bimuria novae-zelandiae CBS 107.79]